MFNSSSSSSVIDTKGRGGATRTSLPSTIISNSCLCLHFCSINHTVEVEIQHTIKKITAARTGKHLCYSRTERTTSAVVSVTLAHATGPSWSHECTIGLRPLWLIHSKILEVLCDDPCSVWESIVILDHGVKSQILEIWDHCWLQHLIPISHRIEIVVAWWLASRS